MLRCQTASLLVLAAGLLAPAAFGTTYKLDPQHTQVVFRIGHMDVSKIYGRFNDVSGSFELNDAGDLTAASAQVDPASIDTDVAARDADVKQNYLNVGSYASIAFKATTITKTAPDTYQIVGNLTLHGATKSITVTAKKLGTGTGMMGEQRVGAETSFTIKRSDYGMSYGIPGAGDEVELLINMEGVRQ